MANKTASVSQIILYSDITDIFGSASMTHDELQKLSRKLDLIKVETKKRAFHQIVKCTKKLSFSKICNLWCRPKLLEPKHITSTKNTLKSLNQIAKAAKLKAEQTEQAIKLKEAENMENRKNKRDEALKAANIKTKKKAQPEQRNRCNQWYETKLRKEYQEKKESEDCKKLRATRAAEQEVEIKTMLEEEIEEMKRAEEMEKKHCILPFNLIEICFKYYEYEGMLCGWRKAVSVGYFDNETTIHSLWCIHSNGKMYKKLNQDDRVKDDIKGLEFVKEFPMMYIEWLKYHLICYQFSEKKNYDWYFINYGKDIAEWYGIDVADYEVDQYQIGNDMFNFVKNGLNLDAPNNFEANSQLKRHHKYFNDGY